MAIQGSCSFTMCIFKYISFLKVNQHSQHSNGSLRFVLFFNVYLQTYFVFESKLTFTTFKWLFKVCALLQCVSSNIFPFWKSKIKIKIKTMSFWSDICPITWEAPGQDQFAFLFQPPLKIKCLVRLDMWIVSKPMAMFFWGDICPTTWDDNSKQIYNIA